VTAPQPHQHQHQQQQPQHPFLPSQLETTRTAQPSAAVGAAGAAEPVARSSNRSSHVFVDPESGTQQSFGSALGLLTRKLVFLIQVR
jgi:hypothetical protein